VLAGGHWVWKRNLLGVLFSSELQLPQMAWDRLLIAWTAFFALLGGLNLLVAYNYSTETWVNFKTFGLLGLTFAYSISTGLYVARHLKSTTHG
jgi:intracellular septation protein